MCSKIPAVSMHTVFEETLCAFGFGLTPSFPFYFKLGWVPKTNFKGLLQQVFFYIRYFFTNLLRRNSLPAGTASHTEDQPVTS